MEKSTEKLKNLCKLLIRKLISQIVKVMYILPVKKTQICFESYEGRSFSCNPKYIYLNLNEKYGRKLEYIWVYQKKPFAALDGVRQVKYKSFNWLKARLTSKVIVFNNIPISFLPIRKNQLTIDTWHAGGAYKRVGSDKKVLGSLDEWRLHVMPSRLIKVFLSSSDLFTRTNIIEGFHYKGKIIKSGMPRNDIFFSENKINKAAEKIRKIYSFQGKCVLYAPTYRGNLHNAIKINEPLNLEKLQKKYYDTYHENIVILVRKHYLDNNDYQLENDNIIDVSDYPDMQELLCASDILITDYSSSIWDYSLLGRPCLLYVPDCEAYADDQGFFIPIEDWPGIVCKSMKSLLLAIENINFNYSAQIAKKHQKEAGSYETGHAAEIICKIIEQFMELESN